MVSILLRNQKLWDGWCQEVGTPNPVLQVKLKGKCCPCSPGVSGSFWRGFWGRMGGAGTVLWAGGCQEALRSGRALDSLLPPAEMPRSQPRPL